jgi:hypothetical protein
MNDAELRDRLREWARPIEATPAPDIEVIRRRARRRVRWVTGLAAACAAVAVLALTVAVPRLIASLGPPAGPTRDTGWIPVGPLPGPQAGPAAAPFLVIASTDTANPAIVYRISAAQPQPRQIAAVRLPGHGPDWAFTYVIAAADDRTFLLTGTYVSGLSRVTRYYELRLRADGRPDELVPLRLTIHGRPEAISPDGTRLAFNPSGGRPGTIGVISLVTGAVRTWVAPGTGIEAMSWDGNRRLAFVWTGPARPRHPALSVLDTASRDTSLMASSRLLIGATVRFGRFTNLDGWQITVTRTAVYAVMDDPFGPPAGRHYRPGIVAFSPRTGRPIRVISQAPYSRIGLISNCGVLWANRSGRQVVTSCGGQIGLTRDGTFTLWSRHSFAPFNTASAW